MAPAKKHCRNGTGLLLSAGLLWLTSSAQAMPTCTVTNTHDSGAGSLRQAILDANAQAGGTIGFNIPGSGSHTISPTSALPALTSVEMLDGNTQPGSSGMPLIELDGTGAGDEPGLLILADKSLVRGLIINRFATVAIELRGGAGNVVQGCYIGTNVSGTQAQPNKGGGIYLNTTSNALIGGTVSDTHNLIAGNTGDGIQIKNGAANTIEGNYIGTDGSGTAALANTGNGLELLGGTQLNIIGGTTPGARNLISGNSAVGVAISGKNTNKNVAQGNFIGTDAGGLHALPNHAEGVLISDSAQGNTIGGLTPTSRNLISGNSRSGVGIGGRSSNYNVAQGNYIGTDITGTRLLSNFEFGVIVWNGAQHNMVGGITPHAGNLVSGNGWDGIDIGYQGTNYNVVQGNYVGTDITGTRRLANSHYGVAIWNGAQHNTLGGTATNAGNLIAGNSWDQVDISGKGTNSNVAQGNYIGTDATGTKGLPSATNGVFIWDGAYNLIGGTANGAGNRIAFNLNDGVNIIGSGTGNAIRGNAIYSNGHLGINLGGAGTGGHELANGVTLNHVGGALAGPNSYQNYPVLTSAVAGSNSTVISGTLNSAPHTTYSIDLYRNTHVNASGYGEGETYGGGSDTIPGNLNVTTDVEGNVAFTLTVPGNFAGQRFTTTATNLRTGDTSEFSHFIAAK